MPSCFLVPVDFCALRLHDKNRASLVSALKLLQVQLWETLSDLGMSWTASFCNLLSRPPSLNPRQGLASELTVFGLVVLPHLIIFYHHCAFCLHNKNMCLQVSAPTAGLALSGMTFPQMKESSCLNTLCLLTKGSKGQQQQGWLLFMAGLRESHAMASKTHTFKTLTCFTLLRPPLTLMSKCMLKMG